MAINDTWVRRAAHVGFITSPLDINVLSIPLNDTILRIHGGLTVIMTVKNHTPFAFVKGVQIFSGLYTTLTTGGTTLLPAEDSGDFAPPLQRWLWWEDMPPVPQPAPGIPYPDSRDLYKFTPMQTPFDIRSKVKATSPIDLHLVLETSEFINVLGDFDVWYWFSVLRSGL